MKQLIGISIVWIFPSVLTRPLELAFEIETVNLAALLFYFLFLLLN